MSGHNDFSIKFYLELTKTPGNLVLSPASVAFALGLARLGARGATASEMDTAVGTPAEQLAAMAKSWVGKKEEGFELTIANQLFGARPVAFEPSYLGAVAELFSAPLERLNFAADPGGCRDHINGWVEQETRNKIVDLLPHGSIDEATRMVLVNAIYFVATWQDTFMEERTEPSPFFAPSGERAVPTMQQELTARHADLPADGLAALELRYASGGFSFVVLLPKERTGIAKLESCLTAARLKEWMDALEYRLVGVRLPRFKIDPAGPILLSEPLGALGIKTLFQYPGADLTGMAPATEELFLGEGYHKCFIAVDEEGTEAAATALGMLAGRLADEDFVLPTPFHADHPFIYIIRRQDSGEILFIGRLVDPTAA